MAKSICQGPFSYMSSCKALARKPIFHSLHDYGTKPLHILIRCHQGRHKIDKATEGPDPDTLLHKELLQTSHVHGMFCLHNANGAKDTHIANPFPAPAGGKALFKKGFNVFHALLPGGSQKFLNACKGSCAEKGIGHEGWPVHESARFAAGYGIGHFFGGQYC